MKRILVVEDDAQVADLIQDILSPEELGCDVEWVLAENGSSALRALDEQEFDLAITDIVLPQISGYEILRLAAKRMPVIVTTGNTMAVGDPDLFQATSAGLGAVSALTKPFDAKELLRLASQAMHLEPTEEVDPQL